MRDSDELLDAGRRSEGRKRQRITKSAPSFTSGYKGEGSLGNGAKRRGASESRVKEGVEWPV